MNGMDKISDRTVARLSLYRRLLGDLAGGGVEQVYSHQLAAASRVTAAQVRRDLMGVGYTGTPVRGYRVGELAAAIGRILDVAAGGEPVALVGLGNLGKAMVTYFSERRGGMKVAAVFDNDPRVVGWIVSGQVCRHVDELPEIVRTQGIRVAIITVPAAGAQAVADRLVEAGITGLVNFAPIRLRVPESVYVENMDMAVALEKAAYFARRAGNVGQAFTRHPSGRPSPANEPQPGAAAPHAEAPADA